MKGFIPAHRKVFSPDHWLAPTKRDPASRLHAWLDLCQMAAHEPMIWRGEKIGTGCTRPTSFRYLAKRWKWSTARVFRFMSDLKASTAIETVTETDTGTVYRIVNYETYAIDRGSDRNSERNANRNSSETPAKQRQPLEPLEPTTRAPKKRRSQLPDEWSPNDAHEAKARALRLDLPSEVEGFRLHAKASGRVQLDWDAAFHIWLKKSTEFKRDRKPNGGDDAWWENLA